MSRMGGYKTAEQHFEAALGCAPSPQAEQEITAALATVRDQIRLNNANNNKNNLTNNDGNNNNEVNSNALYFANYSSNDLVRKKYGHIETAFFNLEATTVTSDDADSKSVVRNAEAFKKLLQDGNGSDAAVEIRDCAYGRGVFAKRSFKPMETVFTDRPIVSASFDLAEHCYHCCKTLTSSSTNVVKSSDEEMQFLKFCSEKCLTDAHEQYHSEIITRKTTLSSEANNNKDNYNNNDAVNSFLQLYKTAAEGISTSRVFPLVIAKLFAHIKKHYPRAKSLSEISFIYLLADQLDALNCDTSMQQPLPKQAFFFSWNAYVNVAKSLGLLYSTEYPFIDFKLFLELERRMTANSFQISEGSSSNKSSTATGLYLRTSYINHSCEPNVVCQSNAQSTGDLHQVIAVKPIKAGEQLFSTYVQLDLSYAQRQYMLTQYGIQCKCGRCQREAAAMMMGGNAKGAGVVPSSAAITMPQVFITNI